jgi:hypothetical protein
MITNVPNGICEEILVREPEPFAFSLNVKPVGGFASSMTDTLLTTMESLETKSNALAPDSKLPFSQELIALALEIERLAFVTAITPFR